VARKRERTEKSLARKSRHHPKGEKEKLGFAPDPPRHGRRRRVGPLLLILGLRRRRREAPAVPLRYGRIDFVLGCNIWLGRFVIRRRGSDARA
jgi:hypothetical protein